MGANLLPCNATVRLHAADIGYEHNEIAAMLGCSIGNSKSQLHKARMKLRESIKTCRAEKAAKQYWGEMKYELRGV